MAYSKEQIAAARKVLEESKQEAAAEVAALLVDIYEKLKQVADIVEVTGIPVSLGKIAATMEEIDDSLEDRWNSSSC